MHTQSDALDQPAQIQTFRHVVSTMQVVMVVVLLECHLAVKQTWSLFKVHTSILGLAALAMEEAAGVASQLQVVWMLNPALGFAERERVQIVP
jgi:hypothetical protein